MTILHISDTHGLHNQLTDLPAADVIVHSGDFTLGGSENEAIEFIQWFCDLPYKHKALSQATMICACMEQAKLMDCRTTYTISATPVLLLNHSETLAMPSLNWQTWTAITTVSTLKLMATAEFLRLSSDRTKVALQHLFN